MKPSPRLFNLIHSLDPSERRFFVQGAKQRKKGDRHLYLELFLAIEKQTVYDEDQLKAQFTNTSFAKSLAFPKSRLYDQVLQSLQQYNYEKTEPSTFRSTLEKVEILTERGFPEQATRILGKGVNHAQEQENAFQMLQLLRWKRRVTLRLQRENYLDALNEIAQLEAEWHARLLTEREAIHLHDELYAMVQETRRKANAAHTQAVQRFQVQLESLAASTHLTFAARIALHRAHTHYYHMLEDFQAVHDAYSQEVKTWEAHPKQIKADPLRYVRAFGQWLNSKAMNQDYAHLLTEIARLRTREQLGIRGQAEVFQITYNLELFYYMNAGRTAEAIPLAPQIAEGLKKYAAYLLPSAKLGFYYNLALVFWLGGEPKGAMTWVNHILQFEKGEIRKDIRGFAPLLEQILHFELGNVGVLTSWFRSLQYKKSRKQPVAAVEEMLAELLRAGVDTIAEKEMKGLFQRFLTQLEAYAKEPGVSKVGLTELKIWAESKC